ncbi:MAG: ferritin family protein [Chloroflexota bacterium]
MATEQDKTLAGLKTAIQMEIDGKAFYLKASRQSGNELGRRLLASLAAEEDIHRQVFEGVYDAIRHQKAWPLTEVKTEADKGLRTIFARATAEMGAKVKAPASELDAVRVAIGMESRSYDFYQERSRSAGYEVEKDFYLKIAAIEQQHHLLLVDYLEYLGDPAGWFVKHEHPSLDGG